MWCLKLCVCFNRLIFSLKSTLGSCCVPSIGTTTAPVTRSSVKGLKHGHTAFIKPSEAVVGLICSRSSRVWEWPTMCAVEACHHKLWLLFQGQNWEIDVETATRLLPSVVRAGRTSPSDLNHFCSLRKRRFLGSSTGEHKMYRKRHNRLGKLNSVPYRLSLKQRGKREKKSELPVTSCNTINLAKPTVNSVCSSAKKLRFVSGMFLDCSE